jgi:hypothetical protein
LSASFARFDAPLIREKHLAMARVLQDQKSGVYRDDRIVHFDGDPEEFADGDTRRRLATRIQNMDTSSSKISQKARS